MIGLDKQPLRVGIAGLGTVGLPVARWLDGNADGGADRLVLAAVSANHKERAAKRVAEFKTPVPVMALGPLAECADVIVECAPPERRSRCCWTGPGSIRRWRRAFS